MWPTPIQRCALLVLEVLRLTCTDARHNIRALLPCSALPCVPGSNRRQAVFTFSAPSVFGAMGHVIYFVYLFPCLRFLHGVCAPLPIPNNFLLSSANIIPPLPPQQYKPTKSGCSPPFNSPTATPDPPLPTKTTTNSTYPKCFNQ